MGTRVFKWAVYGPFGIDISDSTQVCSFEIDGDLSDEQICKILFADRDDKHFFSVAEHNGGIIRDAASQFYDYLVEKKLGLVSVCLWPPS